MKLWQLTDRFPLKSEDAEFPTYRVFISIFMVAKFSFQQFHRLVNPDTLAELRDRFEDIAPELIRYEAQVIYVR